MGGEKSVELAEEKPHGALDPVDAVVGGLVDQVLYRSMPQCALIPVEASWNPFLPGIFHCRRLIFL